MTLLEELRRATEPRRHRLRYMGDSDLIHWDDKPEYREGNNGLGMCNLGSGKQVNCVLGGIGCDVDHAWIAFHRGRET
jgi:hypothetical protein